MNAKATETITRINNALAVTVDQLTGDALRDARDLISELDYFVQKAEADLGAVTSSGIAADDALFRGNSVRYWYDKASAYCYSLRQMYERATAAEDRVRALTESACQRAHCEACGTGVYAQSGVRDAGPAPFGGRNRGVKRYE